MQDPTDPLRDGKPDLVPMIDCIMLLLLFFILTTRFISEDQQIAALLPTDQGARTTPVVVVAPPSEINVVVTPGDLPRGLDEHGYQAAWDRLLRVRGAAPILAATLRIGGSDPILINAGALGSSDPQTAMRQINAIHAYIGLELAAREQAGLRNEQPTVNIHCFSGLSWGYALAAYDAVRAYEGTRQTNPGISSGLLDEHQRTVTFAPPRLRGIAREYGHELWELQHLR